VGLRRRDAARPAACRPGGSARADQLRALSAGRRAATLTGADEEGAHDVGRVVHADAHRQHQHNAGHAAGHTRTGRKHGAFSGGTHCSKGCKAHGLLGRCPFDGAAAVEDRAASSPVECESQIVHGAKDNDVGQNDHQAHVQRGLQRESAREGVMHETTCHTRGVRALERTMGLAAGAGTRTFQQHTLLKRTPASAATRAQGRASGQHTAPLMNHET
jgi:hypothetical protein